LREDDMSRVIVESVSRECCDERKDLKPLFGTGSMKFCVHCGAYFYLDSRNDAAGGQEKYWRLIPVSDILEKFGLTRF
jgi:hypothetical protein